MAKLTFPHDFLWGVATAAFQIEGACDEDGKGPSIWDEFSRTPGKIRTGDSAEVACDHYHRWRQDIALMRSLGLKAYRFSISWPRVLPEGRGEVNEKGIDFYSRLVDELREAGIEPVVTLYHWDLPLALDKRLGGWPNRELAPYFADFGELMYRRLGDRAQRWITINEPWVVCQGGYLLGELAPGHKDLQESLQAGHTLLLAHGMAVERLRATLPGAQVGIAVNLWPVHAATDAEVDRAAAARMSSYVNEWFLDPIYRGDYPGLMREAFGDLLPPFTAEEREIVQSPLDFLGVNNYSRTIVRHEEEQFLGARQVGAPGPVTHMGWEIYPEALREILAWVHNRYSPPSVMITENGAAFEDEADNSGRVNDSARVAYLQSYLSKAHQACEEGVPLTGYFLWSLMDNFEWSYGFSKRFGIVHVDYETQQRTIKRSGEWYAQTISDNALEVS